MTKVQITSTPQGVTAAPEFRFELRAQRGTKTDAKAYGEHLAKTTADADAPAAYARLAIAQEMIKAAMAELKPAVIKQVKRGNAANAHDVKLILASGRTSFDFSGIPSYDKAADRLQKAKDNLEVIKVRLGAKGEGKVKIAPPSLRAKVS